MWRVECKEAMILWVQSMWEMHASQNIYGTSCSDGTFNVPIDALLIGMNHACISVEFLVFFIDKMHDSQSFSLILR